MIDLFLFFCCIIGITLATKAIDLLNFLNPATYFFWIYLLFDTVAFFYRDVYDYAIDISPLTAILIGTGFVCYCCGIFLACNKIPKRLTKGDPYEFIQASSMNFRFNNTALIIICAIPLLFAVAFTLQSGEILWLQDNFDDRRIELRKGSGWIAISGIAGSYVAAIALGISSFKKNKVVFYLPLLVIILLCSISFGNRAPGIDVLVMFLSFVWIRKFRRVSTTHFAFAFFGMMAVVVSLGILRQGLALDSEMLAKQLLWRPFANIQNLEWLVSFVPEVKDYFYGKTFLIELLVLAPGYQPNFGTYMKELMGAEFSGGSITFGIMGMLYADFGPILAPMAMLPIGYLFQKIYLKFSQRNSDLAVLAILSISIKGIAVSGFVPVFIYTLGPCICFYFTLRYILKFKTQYSSSTDKASA